MDMAGGEQSYSSVPLALSYPPDHRQCRRLSQTLVSNIWNLRAPRCKLSKPFSSLPTSIVKVWQRIVLVLRVLETSVVEWLKQRCNGPYGLRQRSLTHYHPVLWKDYQSLNIVVPFDQTRLDVSSPTRWLTCNCYALFEVKCSDLSLKLY